MNKRLYICLEGIDGVGKSTLARMLENYLKDSEYNTEILRTTKPASENDFIEKVFSKFPRMNKSRFLRFFLFAHRSNYAASMIKENSDIIVGDRSIITSYAYRWRRSRFMNKLHIMLVNLFEPRLPSPDYVIYCHADYANIAERLSGRSHLEIDENAARAAWVDKAYREILSDSSIRRLRSIKTLYLDCNGSLDDNYKTLIEVAQRILKEIKE